MARPNGTWGVRGQWNSELEWLQDLGERGRESHRQEVLEGKSGQYSSSSDEEGEEAGRGTEDHQPDPSQKEEESQASDSPANYGSEKNMEEVEQAEDDGSENSATMVPIEWVATRDIISHDDVWHGPAIVQRSRQSRS